MPPPKATSKATLPVGILFITSLSPDGTPKVTALSPNFLLIKSNSLCISALLDFFDVSFFGVSFFCFSAIIPNTPLHTNLLFHNRRHSQADL